MIPGPPALDPPAAPGVAFFARTLIGILLLVMLVPGITARATLVGLDMLRQSLQGQQLQVARAVANSLDVRLQDARSALRLLAAAPALRDARLPASRRFFPVAVAIMPQFYDLVVTDNRGRIRFDRRFPRHVGQDVRRASYFRRVRQVGRGYVSNGLQGPGGRWAAALAVPLQDARGRFLGVLCGFIDLAWDPVGDMSREFLPARGLRTWLVDNQGAIIAHAGRRQSTRPVRGNPVVDDVLGGQADALDLTDSGGVPVLVAYAPLQQATWAVILQRPQQEAYGLLRRMQRILLAIYLVGLGVALALAVFLARRLAGPLEQLVENIRGFGRGQRRHRRLAPAPGELDCLDREFRRMVDQVADLERRRDEMMQMLVHDLKVPLGAISGSSQLVAEWLAGQAGPLERVGQAERMLHNVAASSRQLLQLVNELLDMSRLHDRQELLEFQDVVLQDLIAESLDIAAGLLAARGQRAEVNVATPAPILIRVDPARLGRVLLNLLENACKFSPSGGCIHIGAELSDQEVEVRIEDRGSGLPRERAGLFHKYFQSREGEVTMPRGIGIGLAYCRMMVEAHGGRIRAENNPDRGSCFVLTLPLALIDDEPADLTMPPLE